MRAAHGDALICDFAQYYHVHGLDSLPLHTAATLAWGLPMESRTVREMTGNRPGTDKVFMAAVLDSVRSMEFAVYQSHSKKKLKRPQSVLKRLLGIEEAGGRDEVKGFDTAEEFNAAWERLAQER